MMSTLRQRLRNDQAGFTLIELLVVIIIIGILLAIAVPSYLGFRNRANNSAAQANVRAAIPAAEAYYSDNGSYTAISVATLQAIDSGLSLSNAKPRTVGGVVGAGYCLQSDSDGAGAGTSNIYHVDGPGGSIVSGACA